MRCMVLAVQLDDQPRDCGNLRPCQPHREEQADRSLTVYISRSIENCPVERKKSWWKRDDPCDLVIPCPLQATSTITTEHTMMIMNNRFFQIQTLAQDSDALIIGRLGGLIGTKFSAVGLDLIRMISKVGLHVGPWTLPTQTSPSADPA